MTWHFMKDVLNILELSRKSKVSCYFSLKGNFDIQQCNAPNYLIIRVDMANNFFESHMLGPQFSLQTNLDNTLCKGIVKFTCL